MWIESIDIRGFGCLIHRRYEFPSDRAALIVADNESGKSTLAAAIFAALCGFPSQRRSKGSVTLREAYKPWVGDVYAVEMDILAEGKRFRIERDFARDTFVVRDRETGKDISAHYDRDLARHFLHLPLDDFRRIAFICGKDSPSLGSTDGIQARLSALIEGSTAETGAEPAIAALDGARYSLDTGGPLIIDNAVKRLSESIQSKLKAINALDAALDAAGDDARRLDLANAQLAETRERIAKLDAEFDEAAAAEQASNAAAVEKVRMESAMDRAQVKLEAIDQRRASGKSLGTTIAFVGLVLGLVSVGLLVSRILPTVPSVICTLTGVLIAAAGAVQATRARWIDADARLRLERDIEDARNSLDSLQTSNPDGVTSSSRIDAERRRLRAELDDLSSTVIGLEKRVGAAVDAYKAQYPALRDELQRLERERAKAERFGKAIAIARSTLAEVAEGSRKRWAAALNQSASLMLPHLNPDYNDLRFDDTLAFTVRHIPTGRTLEKPDIDACLSTGAKDQVYLAARLACCEELSRQAESIPVILDDPLMAADDARFVNGFRYIAESFARQHQVIILSCSRERHESLSNEAWFGGCVASLDLSSGC